MEIENGLQVRVGEQPHLPRHHGRHEDEESGDGRHLQGVGSDGGHRQPARLLVRLAARLHRNGRLRRQQSFPGRPRSGARPGRLPTHRLRTHRLLDRRHQAGRPLRRQVQRSISFSLSIYLSISFYYQLLSNSLFLIVSN